MQNNQSASGQCMFFEGFEYGEVEEAELVSRTVPFLAPARAQERLLDVPRVINAYSTGSARNAYGEAAQEIVCATLGLSPVPINGNFETCFDAKRDNDWYEIKSVRKGRKLVIYDWRMTKEEREPNLFYAILVHSIRSEREDIISAMSAAPLSIIVCRAALVHALARECKLNVHKTYTQRRIGYNRAGYKDGYRNLGVKEVLKHTPLQKKYSNPLGGELITLHTEN